jgi:hypothetical protein
LLAGGAGGAAESAGQIYDIGVTLEASRESGKSARLTSMD